MNIIYSGNKLYVDLDINDKNINKNRLFPILDSYEIREIIINTNNNINDEIIGNFVNEYHNKYDGRIKVNYK